MKIHNPHDHLFKKIFSDPKAAGKILQQALPKSITDNLKFDTLKLENTNFVEEKLTEYMSDLVFSCQWKEEQDILVSFILEHKSYLPRFPHIQLLRYLVGGYESQIEQDSKIEKLTPIIPVVIYHGKQKWQYQDFSNYFWMPELTLKMYIPNFEYSLIDLNNWSDEKIKALKMGFAIATLLLFKHQYDKEYFLQHSREIFIFVKDLDETNETAGANVNSLMIYAYQNFGLTKKEIMNFIDDTLQGAPPGFKSAYDVILEMGEEKGLEKGIEIGEEKGMQYNNILKGIKVTLNLHKEMPNLTIEQLANFADIDKNLVTLVLKKIYKKKKTIATKTLNEIFKPIKNLGKKDLEGLLKIGEVRK